MRSFKISRRLILYTSIFFLVYIVSSIFIFYMYLDLYTAHKAQSDNLQDLKDELGEKTKALEQSKLYIKVLEDYRKGLDVKSDGKTDQKKASEKSSPKMNAPSEKKSQKTARREPEQKAAVTELTPKITPEKSRAEDSTQKKIQKTARNEPGLKAAESDKDRKETTEKTGPKESEPGEIKNQETTLKGPEENVVETGTNSKEAAEQGILDKTVLNDTENQTTSHDEAIMYPMEIRNINFQKTDSELTLNFVLANKLAEERTAEGYVHIIVMNKNKECPPEWNIAYDKLSNGFPIDFNHGQEFIIQNFRPYQRKYKTIPDSELPSFIRILVYDRSGQKILEKEFPVTDESSNDPS